MERELELDLHLGGAGVDQLVDRPTARPTPQRPGDRVQQRRLAVTVVAGEHRDVNAVEPQRLVHMRCTT